MSEEPTSALGHDESEGLTGSEGTQVLTGEDARLAALCIDLRELARNGTYAPEEDDGADAAVIEGAADAIESLTDRCYILWCRLESARLAVTGSYDHQFKETK